MEQWEEAAQEGQGSMDETPLNRLIAERFEIEQKIIAAKRAEGAKNEDIDDEHVDDEEATNDWD